MSLSSQKDRCGYSAHILNHCTQEELQTISENANLRASYKPIDYYEDCLTATTPIALLSITKKILHDYGYSIFGACAGELNPKPTLYYMNYAPKSVVDEYFKSAFKIDKDVDYCRNSLLPRVWGGDKARNSLRKNMTSVGQIIERNDIRFTLTVPICSRLKERFGVRYVATGSVMKAEDVRESIPILSTFALYFSDALFRILSLKNSSALLKEKQIQILRLVASGLTTKAIASRLHISENTVLYHLKNIHECLGVKSRFQAVEKAGRMNLI